MATVQENLESTVVELSEDALNAFSDDLSTMFKVDIECTQLETGVQTIKEIGKNFKKVGAFHTVKAEGALSGDFTVAFDQSGLFILAGVIVMLPAKRIKEDAKRGSVDDAKSMADAVGDVGNLLVGSWDRIFREGLEDHKHFSKANTYIGLPWTSPDKTIGLDKSGQFFYVLYEMTLEEFPSFKCGIIFPQEMLSSTALADSSVEPEPEPVEEAQTPAEPEPQARPVAEPEAQAAPEPVDIVQPPAAPEPAPEEVEQAVDAVPDAPVSAEGESKTVSASDTPEVEPHSEEEANTEPQGAADLGSEPKTEELNDDSVAPEVNRIDLEEVDEESVAPKDIPRPVAQPEPSMAIAHSGLADILSLPAQRFMDKTVVWGTPEESVQTVMAKMQQNDVGYAMIGHDGVLEGIVSKSNILGAISPYLRPVFAQWHTPAADATLDIKVKWIMTRPVRTVGPTATLGVVQQTMQQFGGRCLPVIEPSGNVVGIVTCFDIFRVLTRNEPFGMSGRTPQAPGLMI